MVGLGVVLAGDYGISIDEPHAVTRGRESLEIYSGQRLADDTSVSALNEGPFFSMLAYFTGPRVMAIHPGWVAADGRHFVYYLSFVMATVFVGVLVRRYTSRRAAWLIGAAFFTQPLLFGHAFMNPKDSPFMAFFLGALCLGMLALPRRQETDHGGRNESDFGVTPSASALQGSGSAQRAAPRPTGRWLLLATIVAVLLLAGMWLRGGLFSAAQSMLAQAYHAQAPGLIQGLFDRVATDAWKTPLELYQSKLAVGLSLIRYATTLAIAFGVLLAWAWRAWPRPTHGRIGWGSYVLVASAGLMAGLAASIRSIAPLAVLPLAFVYILEFRKRSPLYLMILGGAAAAACIASWPFLWKDPLGRFVEAVGTLSRFPWDGDLLFNGHLFETGQQPWYYIPSLMALQLTLPVMGLALLGLWALVRRVRPRRRIEIGALVVSMALPVAASLQPGTIVYSNFRHFLFVVPGFFLLAALGVGWLFDLVSRKAWRIGLATVVLLPGIVGIVRLHPYEYIYYNALASISGNVYRSFESDYWCTSYRTAIEWVNLHAERGATIEIGGKGGPSSIAPFARPDLHVISMAGDSPEMPATWAILCDGKGGILNPDPGGKTVFVVEVDGAILSQVKELHPSR